MYLLKEISYLAVCFQFTKLAATTHNAEQLKLIKDCSEWQQCDFWSENSIYYFRLYGLKLVNEDPQILPNIRLGAQILDTCSVETHALEQSLEFIKTIMSTSNDLTCADGSRASYQRQPIVAVIGAASSQVSVMVASMLQLFKVSFTRLINTYFSYLFFPIPQLVSVIFWIQKFRFRFSYPKNIDSDSDSNGIDIFSIPIPLICKFTVFFPIVVFFGSFFYVYLAFWWSVIAIKTYRNGKTINLYMWYSLYKINYSKKWKK